MFVPFSNQWIPLLLRAFKEPMIKLFLFLIGLTLASDALMAAPALGSTPCWAAPAASALV